ELRLAVGSYEFGIDTGLIGIGIVDDLRRKPRADREIFELRAGRGIANLMRGLGPARWTGDHIATLHRVALGADDELALAFEDKEHLLVDAVTVARKSAFARRHDGEVVAELLRANLGRDRAEPRFIALIGPRHADRLAVMADLTEFGEIGDIEDRTGHGASLRRGAGRR